MSAHNRRRLNKLAHRRQKSLDRSFGFSHEWSPKARQQNNGDSWEFRDASREEKPKSRWGGGAPRPMCSFTREKYKCLIQRAILFI
jgi:hypothetical protein